MAQISEHDVKLNEKIKKPEPRKLKETEQAREGDSAVFRSYYANDVIYYIPSYVDRVTGRLVPGKAVEFDSGQARVTDPDAINFLRASPEYGIKILEVGVHDA